MSKSVIHALLAVAFLAALFSGAVRAANAVAAQVPVPALTARVADQTGTLDTAQQHALETKLESFENSNGAQIAVLVVPTTGDETIEQYSIRVVDAWKLGRQGVDDGVLLLVAKNDRKVRIEVGRGLEGVIPDAIANRIIDGFITPQFLAGDYARGLNDGVDRIIGVANGEALPQPTKLESGPASDVPTTGVPIPAMTAHVVNQTTMLTDPQVQALDAKLAAFEKGKGRRIAILLVDSTGEESDEQYSDRVFDAWKLGDDGVLILVTQNPYDERITVGHGLVGVFTHPVIKRILDEDMSWPRVKLGDIAGELNGGADRIIRLENGEAMPPPSKPENSFDWGTAADWFAPPPFGTWIGTLVALIFAFVIGVATLEDASAFRRGGVTALLVGLVLWIAGAGIGFLLSVAAIALYFGMTINTGAKSVGGWGTFYEDLGKDDGRSSDVSGWSILGTVAGGLISSAISSGGGGGGFRGGGGGFSGGGASGSW